MNTCPCCSNKLLRHIRCSNVYWFCSHCRQEMPNFERAIALSPQLARKPRRSNGISPLKLPVESFAETDIALKSEKERDLAVSEIG